MLSGTIYNGVADWLYEEEILGTDTALWPHAASLAFLSFNDTEVEAGTLVLSQWYRDRVTSLFVGGHRHAARPRPGQAAQEAPPIPAGETRDKSCGLYEHIKHYFLLLEAALSLSKENEYWDLLWPEQFSSISPFVISPARHTRGSHVFTCSPWLVLALSSISNIPLSRI